MIVSRLRTLIPRPFRQGLKRLLRRGKSFVGPSLEMENTRQRYRARLRAACACLTSHATLQVMQVGAHVGGTIEPDKGDYSGHLLDPIYPLVKLYDWRCILLEPEPDACKQLREFYRGYESSVQIEQAAITEGSGSTTPVWFADSLHASLGRNRGDASRTVLDHVKIRGLTFKEALEIHAFDRLDLLVIDVEGFEYRLLRTFPFEWLMPSIISLEHRHVPTEELAALYEMFLTLGYFIFYKDDDDLIAVSSAFKARLLGRSLLAIPVGAQGKDNLRQMLTRFPKETYDVLVFGYDETQFSEPEFDRCKIIRERGFHTHFFKQYLTPAHCADYEFIFPWMDDIELGTFDPSVFIDVMLRNGLELAQPALMEGSIVSHDITRQSRESVGRRTNFVELMAQVFHRDAWSRYWHVMSDDSVQNPYGWGYDFMAGQLARIDRMGIIDSQTVKHTRRFSATPTLELSKVHGHSLAAMKGTASRRNALALLELEPTVLEPLI